MFHPFQIEQFLSEHEEGVAYNFSESGVNPLTLAELMEIAGHKVNTLGKVLLNYPEVRGTEHLRRQIATLYNNVTSENVLVTVGASEANHLIAATLLEPGDEFVTLSPTYQQLLGNARNLGITLRTVPLVEEQGWALDTEALNQAVGPLTKIIAVVNPNNPTGHILSNEEMAAVIAVADRYGAWIVADEVYAGTELGDASITPSFWGCYERVIAINSMSKAYGMPGLRLGWLVAPVDTIPSLWRRHEYATVASTMLSNRLAEIALRPDVRAQLIARARRLISRGFEHLQIALQQHEGVFSVTPPQASAISLIRYALPIGSHDLALRLKTEKGVLVVPGEFFGIEHCFRFSSALPEAYLSEGLGRLNALVGEILA